jgi:predicted nucleic acid-binding protein
MKILFDTNVLVYAHDEYSIYHNDSAELLQLAINHTIQGILAEQNIVELYRVLTNPKAMKGKSLTPIEVTNLLNEVYLNSNFEILYPTPSTLEKVLKLATINNINSAQIFDIRLVALMLNQNINYLAIYNTRHFERISNINPLKPPEIFSLIKTLDI